VSQSRPRRRLHRRTRIERSAELAGAKHCFGLVGRLWGEPKGSRGVGSCRVRAQISTGTVMRVRTYTARERFAARALAARVESSVPQEAGSADRARATHTTGSH
jgi:hypothetical protein